VTPASGSSPYVIEALERRHDRKAFSCGQADLDRYLKQQARQDARRRAAATFVAVERGQAVVVGYYSLSATGVPLRDLPPQTAARLPRYPLLPATLLGRLAVDRNHQGRKLGELLLADALQRSLAQSDEIGSMAVIVDAIDDRARSFYEHFQFIPFPDQPRRLFLPMESIAGLFGQKTPPTRG
jgi:GNAT superfamily N-acetyltransferase